MKRTDPQLTDSCPTVTAQCVERGQDQPISGAGPAQAGLLGAGTELSGGRISVQGVLGQGAAGVVYQAFDAQRQEVVALKVLFRMEPTDVYRLKNEFRSLSKVNHQNLVKLHELFSDGDRWFFTMDLVRGERFDVWVRPNGDLDVERLRSALLQLVTAVQVIHEVGKLHRDLKPGNVLVDEQGRVAVLDFGLAVDPELGSIGQTIPHVGLSGTPAYMAPEQAVGDPATEASDYYALGVMLFQALTGQLPFQGRAGQMLAAKQRQVAPLASHYQPDAPPELVALCARLLEREPAARPNGERLRAELQMPPFAFDVAACALSAPPKGRNARLEADVRSHLLGRERELDELRDAYRASLNGQAVVMFVSGESGMGKSALVAHFLDELRAEGQATVLQGRCCERENVPFKGFDSLVDDLSRHLRRLPCEDAALLLPREVYALARLFPVLERVPVVAAAPKKDVPDLQDLKRRAFLAFGELLGRIRDRRPLVIFIDDLQWTDLDSVWFMQQLFGQLEPVPALLILSHRSEDAGLNGSLHSLHEAATTSPALSFRRLAIGPLPERALKELAHRLLNVVHEPAVDAALAAEAQGSPFFVAELVRAVRFRASGQPIPSLGQALSLHISDLPESARRLLALLALVGQPLAPLVAFEAAAVADGSCQLDLLRSEQLVRVNLLSEGTKTIECYHDKIAELIAGDIGAELSRELWLGLSIALPAEADADLELLARCHEGAGNAQQAAQCTARAAEQAYAALAFDRAADLYTRALQRGLFEAERIQQLRVSKAEALMRAGRAELAAEAFLEARRGADEEHSCELTRLAGAQLLMCGQLDRGRELLALALARDGISFPIGTAGAFASALWSQTRLRLRNLSFTRRDTHDCTTLRKLDALRMATHCLTRSDHLRAADFGARWILLALDSGHAVELARALAWSFQTAGSLQTPEARIEAMHQLCEQLCQQTGDAMASSWLRSCYATHLSTYLGQPQAAMACFERAFETWDARPYPQASYDRASFESIWLLSAMFTGRMAETERKAQVAFDDALARGDHPVAVFLSWPLGVACVAADKPVVAQRVFERADLWCSGEMTLQDFMLMLSCPLSELYQGDAVQAWADLRPRIEAFRRSLLARVMFRGVGEQYWCGVAAAAALATPDPLTRSALEKEARRLAKSAITVPTAGGECGCPGAVLACLRGDRRGAIDALRTWLAHPQLCPLGAHLSRRRLGALLGGDEGNLLVRQSDEALSKGGVVNPERFVATMYPGIELR